VHATDLCRRDADPAAAEAARGLAGTPPASTEGDGSCRLWRPSTRRLRRAAGKRARPAGGHDQRWYNIQYTTTPVTETYAHSGSVTRAMRRWRSNRSRRARVRVTSTSGTMTTARVEWLRSRPK